MRTVLVLAAFGLASLLVGCQGQDTHGINTNLDQDSLCIVNSMAYDKIASQCEPGEKIVFLPPLFGNAQLPIKFAAVYCDLRYTVALTKGAVTCIYLPSTLPGKHKTTAKKQQKSSQGPTAKHEPQTDGHDANPPARSHTPSRS